MSRSIKPAVAALAIAAIAASGAASARQSDRGKPMDIESASGVCGAGDNATCTFTGKVTITQGTLRIVADKAVVTQSGGNPRQARFSGGVTLFQQMDDGTNLDAKASNIDYDLKTEVVTFTGNVTITQQRGTLNGERVVYDMKTGQVESGGGNNGRVKMRILPKGAQAQGNG
ncbi:MAG: lipopolysaccharide transport periplasmic protein LptA [Thermomonas sp.]|uniref:lipopolysaccharide transport periplasmic protein LptA n=1 Tax=Thermomonas sp. TaxID=1971895 RepID=UPI0039E568E0